jgi:ribonuclease HI
VNSGEVIIVYTDGASKGNPGKASIGVSIQESNKEIATVSKAVGVATNNIAEYTALLEALKACLDRGLTKVLIRADSELMVKQLKGEYKVKNPEIKVIYDQAKILERKFEAISYEHVMREKNKRADELANLALENLRY